MIIVNNYNSKTKFNLNRKPRKKVKCLKRKMKIQYCLPYNIKNNI